MHHFLLTFNSKIIIRNTVFIETDERIYEGIKKQAQEQNNPYVQFQKGAPIQKNKANLIITKNHINRCPQRGIKSNYIPKILSKLLHTTKELYCSSQADVQQQSKKTRMPKNPTFVTKRIQEHLLQTSNN